MGHSYKDIDYLADYTATTVPECTHHTGWFFTVKVWIFKRRYYWCDLCHTPIDLQKAREEWEGLLDKK